MKKLLYLSALVLLIIGFIVWQSPHWQSLNIHDVATFRVVLLLGFFQTVAAIYGAYLAVLALPLKERGGHPFLCTFLGAFLFCLTFCVGILNDRSQNEIRVSLNASTVGLKNVFSWLPTLKRCDVNGVDGLQNYILGVIGATSNPSRTAKSPLVTPLVAPPPISPAQAAATPQPESSVPPPNEASLQLHLKIKGRIEDLGTADNVMLNAIRNDQLDLPRIRAFREDPNYFADKIAPAIVRYSTLRHEKYEKEIRPKLEEISLAAQNQLRMSFAQMQADRAAFGKADGDATAPDPQPEPTRVGPAYEPKFTSMIAYLRKLDEQVWNPQTKIPW